MFKPSKDLEGWIGQNPNISTTDKNQVYLTPSEMNQPQREKKTKQLTSRQAALELSIRIKNIPHYNFTRRVRENRLPSHSNQHTPQLHSQGKHPHQPNQSFPTQSS
jgi:hypothetical protein